MFSVKDSSFGAAPFEAPANYNPFFARKSIKMFPNSYSCHSIFSETKPVESATENLDSNATMPETDSSVIGSLLMDDYPDPESPYASDSDNDKLYIDLDPPANYQRRASVNCFTTPISKKVTKDVPTASEAPATNLTASKDKSIDTQKEIENGNPKKLKDRSHDKPGKSKTRSVLKTNAKGAEKSVDRKPRPELNEKERGDKSRDGKRRKRRHFVNKATQTELEFIIPSSISSLLAQKISLEQGQQGQQGQQGLQGQQGHQGQQGQQGHHGQRGMQPYRSQERARGAGGIRERSWQSRVNKRPFGPDPADLRYVGQEPPAKRARGPSQEEDDSDMDPPIRTIT